MLLTSSSQDCKILIFGDLHVEERALEECEAIIDELCEYGKKEQIDSIIQLGDLCDKNKLNSSELFALTRMMVKLRRTFKNVIVMEGNHDKTEKNVNIIQYLKFFGIIVEQDQFSGTMQKVDGLMSNDRFLLGHWFVDKSAGAFGHFKYTVEALKEFKYVILGHQHDFQQVTDSIVHLGSARYTSFGENHLLKKRFAILNNASLSFVDFKSTISLFKVSSIQELENIPDKAKVQYEFKSFEQLKEEIKTINELKNRFFAFKKKNDFIVDDKRNILQSSPKRDIRQIISDFLGTIKEAEIKNLLEEEFKGELT